MNALLFESRYLSIAGREGGQIKRSIDSARIRADLLNPLLNQERREYILYLHSRTKRSLFEFCDIP